jgi:uncharacterized protein HemY
MHKLLNTPVIFGSSLEVYAIMIVIAIPTFFFWRWVLKKYIKDYKRRTIFIWFFTGKTAHAQEHLQTANLTQLIAQ